MDAGGLAQMTYNSHNALGGGLGMPGTGFGSRGKGGNIKRLSVPPPPSAVHDANPAPRTSRSHLLAGLRTAPKSPSFPTSAPPNQLQQPGFRDSHLSPMSGSYQPPKTATGMGYSGHGFQNQSAFNMAGQLYSPDQILAPPAIQIGDVSDGSHMDPQLYDELMRTNQYLAQQQMRLQQQLINVTAAAQQFQSMNLSQNQGSPYGPVASSPSMSIYHQQLSQGVQPVIQPVPGSAGLFTVYNPLTGQTTLAYDNGATDSVVDAHDMGHSPANAPAFRARVSSPPPQSPSPINRASNWRSNSPPKRLTTPPRDDALPLPPPSANAFRTNHRKNNLSLAKDVNGAPAEGIRTGGLKSAGFPRTPMTGTFGPGQAQEGEHPVRQPRGPPSMEDLVAKPTTKFEGSKNFASRQRRSALKNLVRAGMERRGARSIHSADSGSPTSEHGTSLSTMSDVDDVASVRSGSASLAGKPAFDKPPTPNVGVIGAERKELRERSRERQSTDYSAVSVSSDDDAIGGKLIEVKVEAPKDIDRKSNLQLLASAEKRRSLLY